MKNAVLMSLFLITSISRTGTDSVLSPTVHVIEHGGYLQYLTINNAKFTSCQVSFESYWFTLDVNSTKTAAANTEDPSNLANRIHGLGQGLCGFKFLNATYKDPEDGVLAAADVGGSNYSAEFHVYHYDLEGLTNTTQEVTLGLTTTLACGWPQAQSQDFCYLYNPAGQLASSGERCSFIISLVSMADIGIWRCIIGVPQNMETLEASIEVKLKEFTSIESWVTEEDDHISVGCRIMHPTMTARTFCEMINPRGRRLVIRPGSAAPRYTSLKTDLSKFVCAIEIEKPLENSDIGPWKCRINDLGTSFTVGNFSGVELYSRRMSLPVQLNKAFTIDCQVPYSATYCYVTAPNGTRYTPDVPTRVGLGECSLRVPSSWETDNGTWTCSFFRANELVDDVLEVEVFIVELLSYLEAVKSVVGDTAELICQAGGLPLQYCFLISPSGAAYQLHAQQHSSKLAYVGKGLDYGDCGVRITNVQNEDLGNWTCVVRIGQAFRQGEISAIILLYKENSIFTDMDLATTLGIFIGATIAVAGMLGFIMYRRWKRRRSNERGSDEQLQLSSNEPVFNMVDYNATQASSNPASEVSGPGVYRKGRTERRNTGGSEGQGSSDQWRNNETGSINIHFPNYGSAQLTNSIL